MRSSFPTKWIITGLVRLSSIKVINSSFTCSEGGLEIIPIIKALVDAGISIIGHTGFSLQSREIGLGKTNEEICEIIGADSLGFLSEQGLIDSIGLNYDAPYTGLCMECYNGDYSAGLYDYEESYVNSMTDIQKQFLKERGRM